MVPATQTMRRLAGRAVILATVASLAVAAAAAAHGSGPHSAIPRNAHHAVKLRECWMTVAYVPRPAAALEKDFPKPPDLGQTFYGPDPLLGVWAVSCQRGRVTGKRVGRVEHSNRFGYRAPGGQPAQLGLATDHAFDRFCFPASGGCSATLAAPPGSALARLLGHTVAAARVGFDHGKLDRLDLSTHRLEAGASVAGRSHVRENRAAAAARADLPDSRSFA